MKNDNPNEGFDVLTLNSTKSTWQFARFQQHWRIPAYLSIALVLCSVFNMVLFHTLVELFAIGVAIMSFVVSWTTYSFSRNKFLVFLGCGYFWVGILDLFHTLTFANIGVFKDIAPSVTLQLWLGARYLEVFTLLSAPLIQVKNVQPKFIFLSLGLLSTAIIGASLIEVLPKLFILGKGLTTLKIYNEYLLIALFSIVIIRLTLYCPNIEPSTRHLLITSSFLTILAELNFTLYTSMNEFTLVTGHIFKLFSFWAIYRLLIEYSLTRPMNSLSQVLESYDRLPDPTVIIDQHGTITQANKIVREQEGSQIIGENCHQKLHSSAISENECQICRAIINKEPLKAFEFFDTRKQLWFEASLSGIHYSEQFSASVHTLRDITTRKQHELQFSSLNRVYRLLSHTNQAIVRLHDQDLLLQEICDIAVQQGNLKMAWIGIIQNNVVQPTYISGEDRGYFKKLQMRVDDSEWAKGPVGLAVNTQQVSYVNDVDTHSDFWPWRKAANERGFAALAAVPLFFKGKVFAVFTLYSAQKNVFETKMANLLSQLSNDISSALFNIHQAEQKLLSEATIRQLTSAVEQSADAIIITNTQGTIEYTNPEFTVLTGYSAKEVLGKYTSFLRSDQSDDATYQGLWKTITSGEQWRGELLNRKKDGRSYWSKQTIAPIKNEAGETTHFVSTSTDNTKLHDAQETIQQLAFYDPLTDLANRRLLMDRLDHAITSSARHHEKVGVFMCDLDNFKHINDSLGHDAGDKLLQHIAGILELDVHEEDTVARLGGDEFTIVVTSFQNELALAEIANKILSNLEIPVNLLDKQVVVSSSIGIAIYPQDGKTADALMRAADLAMYHAKEDGKNRFQFYQQEMNDRAQNRLHIEHALLEAINENAFELFYQPQVSIEGGGIVGLEALIRWKDKQGNYIPPYEFIPIAEESGLIEQIGDWVIKQAMQDWEQLIIAGKDDIKMAVNVSAFQFNRPENLCSIVTNALKKHPVCPPDNFTLELTESTLIENIEETIQTLNTLKSLGVNLSIDDFGTGYSSLNYLKRFPMSQLKIDKSFIDDMVQGERDAAIVTSIINLAKNLDMKIIAEGVETKAQADLLLQKGCAHAQGYLYHKPMPLEKLRLLN